MGQMLVEAGKIEENFARAVNMVKQAAQDGCKIIILPECFDIGWTHLDAKTLAKPLPGPLSDKLCAMAKQSQIFIVAGLTEIDNDKIYNSAVLISPTGDILLKHRKINVLDIAQDTYEIGDRLGVAETELGTIGINICADNFPDSLSIADSLVRMGAQVILSPCAWAVPADHDNENEPYGSLWKNSYTKLTSKYDVTVVGVSNVGWIEQGPWKGRKCIGCSLAVGPAGKIITQGPYGVDAEELIEIEVELIAPKVKGTQISEMLEGK